MIDLVYFIGIKSYKYENWELRYSLRSFNVNMRGLRGVYIIGNKPNWVSDKVHHIPFPDHFQHSKDSNLINKLIRCSMIDNLTTRFIRCSDDQLLLKPTYHRDFAKPFRHSKGQTMLDKLNKMKERDQWHKAMYNTILFLQSKNLPFDHYDCHLPQVMDKRKCGLLIECPYQHVPGMIINTLYFNYCFPEIESVPMSAAGTYTSIRKREYTQEEIAERLEGKRFAEYTNDGMRCPAFVSAIEKMFPDPSPYEN